MPRKDKSSRYKYNREYYIKNKEKINNHAHQYNIDKRLELYEYNIKRRFNITLKEYNELFEQQNSCCAICGIHQNELKRKLDIDHDHKTGEIRGLLCNDCNLVLANAKDNIDVLINAIRYLNKEAKSIRPSNTENVVEDKTIIKQD